MKLRLSILCTALFALTLASCTTAQNSITSQKITSSASAKSSENNDGRDQIRKKLTDAFLDDRLRVEVIHEVGGRNPCEPREAYYRMKVSRHVIEPYLANPDAPDGGHMETREKWEETDLGQGIFLIESTGKIEVMDVCLE